MDEQLLRAWNGVGTPAAVALSSRWMLVVVGVPLAAFLVRRRRWTTLLSIVLAVGATDVVSSRVLKPLLARERPCRTLTGIATPTGCGPAKSLPSSHAANAFALAVSAATVFRFAWSVLIPLAILVALSRVSLGVHYPSDILVGALLGTMIGGLAWVLRIKIPSWVALRRRSTSEPDPPDRSLS